MGIEFKKAERQRVKLKLGVTGVSGAGKTFTSLLIAKGLAEAEKGYAGRIAVLDTENGSASLYSDSKGMPEFDTFEMQAPFLTNRYIEVIEAAARAQYDVLIIDSASHQWSGEGGIMDRMDKDKLANPKGNSFSLWAKYTPEHAKFLQAIVQAPIHIIVCMRSKQEYALEKDENGKMTPRKMGLAPVQRDQFEYELSCVFDLSTNHYASVSKDRTGLFDSGPFLPTEKTGDLIARWLMTGKELKKHPNWEEIEALKNSMFKVGSFAGKRLGECSDAELLKYSATLNKRAETAAAENRKMPPEWIDLMATIDRYLGLVSGTAAPLDPAPPSGAPPADPAWDSGGTTLPTNPPPSEL